MNKRTYLTGYILLLALVLTPIWFFSYPPLQDYPNHLARMFIFGNIKTHPFLGEYYATQMKLVPNLAMELLVPFLSSFISIFAAGKVFLSLTIFLITSGSLFLSYAIQKKVTLFSFFVFLLVFNQAFLKGFMNYLFGTGLLFWMLGIWLLLMKKPMIFRILFALVSGVLVFLCHLSAYGMLGIMLFGVEITPFIRKTRYQVKQGFLSLLPIVFFALLPAILFLSSPTSDTSLGIRYNPFYHKFSFYFLTLLPEAHPISLIGIGFLAILFLIGVVKRYIILYTTMLPSILSAFIIYLLMPSNLITTSHADWRLLLPILVLLFTSLSFRECPRMYHRVLRLGFGLLFSVHLTLVLFSWQSEQRIINDYIDIIDDTENGERIATFFISDEYSDINRYGHIPSYAVIIKDAFIPILFSFGSQQPLSYTEPYNSIKARTPDAYQKAVEDIDVQELLRDYTYIIFYNPKHKDLPNEEGTEIIAERGDFFLMKHVP